MYLKYLVSLILALYVFGPDVQANHDGDWPADRILPSDCGSTFYQKIDVNKPVMVVIHGLSSGRELAHLGRELISIFRWYTSLTRQNCPVS